MGKKVLLVDDDADFKEAVSVLLEAKGYEVLMAATGSQGYDLARQERPDIILLDVMMTHRTEGFDIAHKLHGDPLTKDIPVIMVTGICTETGVAFRYEPDEVWLPVKAVIDKPVRPEVLLKAVEESIGK